MSEQPLSARRHASAPAASDDGIYDGEEYTVRPYALTGGRTSPSSDKLPVEALVQGLGQADLSMPRERRQILELTASQYLSVAELSAHVKLPVGVVRVIVSDMADEQRVRVHGLTPASDYNPGASLSVLESVLNGISAL